jgi:UDP-N-acetylmuramoyl-tripeptide--D-alanyl-D-alanine ligase
LELGINHFGEMDRLGAICKPTMGMITNAGPAHLEFLENLEGVARAKGELLPHIDAGGYAILNADDVHVAALKAQAACEVVFFGTSPEADIRAEAVAESPDHITFDLILPGERLAVKLNTPGRFMVTNALAAAAVGHLAGVGAEDIRQGLESFMPAKGRLQVVATAMGISIIDDTYNANPASMAAAIQTFKNMRAGSRGLIALGDMLELGAQSGRLHREVGAIAGSAGAAKLYAYGEYAEDVLSGAREAGMPEAVLMTASKEEIAADLIEQLRPGDWLLVKGSRGMAMETVVKAVREWTEAITIE